MACCTHHPVISETLLTKPFCIHVSLLSHWKLERELYCAPLENACHTQCQATLTTGAPLTISSCGQVCRLVPWAILILLCSWGCNALTNFCAAIPFSSHFMHYPPPGFHHPCPKGHLHGSGMFIFGRPEEAAAYSDFLGLCYQADQAVPPCFFIVKLVWCQSL